MTQVDGPHSHPLIEGEIEDLRETLAYKPTPFGVAVSPRDGRTEAAEIAYLQAELGREIGLHYSFSSSLPADFGSSPMRVDSARRSLWSFKMLPDEALAQDEGGPWAAFVESIPSGITQERRDLIYWQEPGDEVRAGKLTAAEYRAAFDHLYSFIDAPNVRLGVNLSSWDFDLANNRLAAGTLLVPDSAQFMGLSLFANSVDPNVNRDALGRALWAAERMGVPVGLSSIGVSSEQSASKVVSWLAHLALMATAQRAKRNPLEHIVCYSSNKVPAGWSLTQWWMDGSPTVLAAWRDLYDVAVH